MAFIKAWPTWRGTTDHKAPCMKKLTLGERTHGGLILGSGTSSDPKTSTTADEKFMSFYFSDSATSGDSRGLYLRHYIAGAGGGGESLRAFTSIDDVAGATAHGAHISLGFETSGSLTGTGSALRVTHHIPETARSANNVNYNVIQAEIWSDAATSDPNASQLSVFRIVNGGNTTGAVDVDTDAYLFYLDGWTSGSGKMYYGSTLRVYAGGAKYLVMSSAEDSLTMDGRFVCDDTTDTTSGTTGSIQTDGGVGIAKALYVGTTLTVAGSRLILNGVASSGVTDGSVIRMGTSGSPLTDDQAGAGFVVGYFDSGDTSGWPAGLYINTNVTGAGGSFTALQGDATLTAAKATVTGIENFMALSTGGRVTGACRSVQGTIDFGNEDKGSGGVYSGACFNIKGEGSAVDIGEALRVSCLELKTEGTFSSNAGENFQTASRGYAIYLNGFTAGDGSIIHNAALTWTDALASVLGLKVGIGGDAEGGSIYYIPMIPAAEWN